MKIAISIICFLSFLPCFGIEISGPFKFEVKIENNFSYLNVEIPKKHYIYADSFRLIDSNENLISPLEWPNKNIISDPNNNSKQVYSESFSLRFNSNNLPNDISIKYHGCNDTSCFFPGETNLFINDNLNKKVINQEEVSSKQNPVFIVKKRASEYMSPNELLAFLTEEKAYIKSSNNIFNSFITDPVSFINESGSILTIILILLGGLLLNLTPCVLPMIPVNIAIIGAGAQAGSKKIGFKLGAYYGLGIILAYGLLGVITILTGSIFGEINSNPWFNLLISLIFIILAFIIFDLLKIDFSKIQNISINKNKSKNITAFSMGSLSGVLAGACVAPVVIAVLILSSDIYNSNPSLGLSLPFMLGLGMSLPWPFIGAGLFFIPKPGKWMIYVKYLFGTLMLILSIWYMSLFIKGLNNNINKDTISTSKDLNYALASASLSDKNVIIDFWAYWCKSCNELDKSFQNAKVKEALKDFIFIKFDASNFDNTENVLEEYDILGLPTLIILERK